MKKISFLLVFLVCTCYAGAQSNIGFLTDNYSGVSSVIANPANITTSKLKVDINLIGFSAFAGNDYYGVNVMDALKDGYDFDLSANKTPTNDNNIAFNIDVMGPAFMFNLNEVSSIAVFTRARTMFNANQLNGETIDGLDNDNSDDFNVNEGDFNLFAHGWAEVGATYARTLLDAGAHSIKAGITLKYLQGVGTAYAYGKNVTIDYDANGIDPNTGSVTTTGALTYGYFADFDNSNYEYELPNATGFGADLGFVYEWRPNTQEASDNYKLKLGVSITDIGQINYKDALTDTYNINRANINEDEFDQGDDYTATLTGVYGAPVSQVGYSVQLPTAVHLNADLSLTKNFYVNLNTDFSLIAQGKDNATRISNVASLTPRFESKWFSFFVPISVIENNGFQAGAGLRLGPLYLGSGSVLTTIAGDDSRGADFYAGLKIPIF